MGMAASQARLLTLTNRKNHIGYDLTMLSAQKMALANESDRIAMDYSNALNEKRLKWSNDAGATTYDLTYATLMNPSKLNAYEPYMLTDHAGKVVVDNSYLKYAKMVSPNGAPGGNYDVHRNQILAELLGISAEDFDKMEKNTRELEQLRKTLAIVERENHPLETLVATEVLLGLKNASGHSISSTGSGIPDNCYPVDGNTSWTDIITSIRGNDSYIAYLGHDIEHGDNGYDLADAKAKLRSVITDLANAVYSKTGETYIDVDQGSINKAIDDTYNLFVNNMVYDRIWDSDDWKRGDCAENAIPVNGLSQLYDNPTGWGHSHNTYAVNVTNLANVFLINLLGTAAEKAKINGTAGYEIDTENTHLTTRKSKEEFDAWQAYMQELKDRIAELEDSLADPMDAELRKKVAFYDSIFRAIEQFGWSHNEHITDNDYLNEVLQNGMYNITQGERTTTGWEYDESTPTTCPNIFTVSDSDLINKANAEYEARKMNVNKKEKAIDTKMQKLETEQTAISEMLEAYRGMIKDNTDRTFNTFG